MARIEVDDVTMKTNGHENPVDDWTTFRFSTCGATGHSVLAGITPFETRNVLGFESAGKDAVELVFDILSDFLQIPQVG